MPLRNIAVAPQQGRASDALLESGLAQAGAPLQLETGFEADLVRKVPPTRARTRRRCCCCGSMILLAIAAVVAVSAYWQCLPPGIETDMLQASWQCLKSHAIEDISASPASSNAPFIPNSPSHPPPLFRITATSPYLAGLQHGRLAKERIHLWFNSTEMQKIFTWVLAGSGSVAFSNLKRDNTKEFPTYVDEMTGIAEGAAVTLDQVWCANMMMELENLMHIEEKVKRSEQKGCSDIYAVSEEGYAGGFAHGHNDDWSPVAKQFWYFVAVTPAPNATDIEACAGVVYPATLVGWAPTWNSHGIFATQNTLMPSTSKPGGLGCLFVQKRAVCSGRNLDDVIHGLTRGGWSDAASMNVVDLNGKRMANIELWEDISNVVEVTEAMGNYSHFNQFKHTSKPDGTAIDNKRDFSKDVRQQVVDALPKPRSATDVMDRLSNPILFNKDGTLVTVVVDGASGMLNIWCCGVTASSNPTNPIYSTNLHNFF